MEPHSDVTCALKVNVHCDACKGKMLEVLSSIIGVYDVNIDGARGIVEISGEVDPNILLKALARTGNHAEILWSKIRHPMANRGYHGDGYGYGYGHNCYGGGLEDPYHSYGYRTLPERWCETNYGGGLFSPMRRMMPDYPYHNAGYYGSSFSQPRFRPFRF